MADKGEKSGESTGAVPKQKGGAQSNEETQSNTTQKPQFKYGPRMWQNEFLRSRFECETPGSIGANVMMALTGGQLRPLLGERTRIRRHLKLQTWIDARIGWWPQIGEFWNLSLQAYRREWAHLFKIDEHSLACANEHAKEYVLDMLTCDMELFSCP